MATPTYPATQEISDDTNVPLEAGYKRVKSWWWDDNLNLINALLERLTQAVMSQGGVVVVPGTVVQNTNVAEVTGRIGVTNDGVGMVAAPTLQSWDFSVEADGYYLLVLAPTMVTINRNFVDPDTSQSVTHVMPDEFGELAVVFDAGSFPSTPSTALACAQVQVASSAITAFNVITELPIYRDNIIRASAVLDFPSIAAAAESELTVAATGAIAGDTVSVGAPAAIEAGLSWSAYVSAADTVTIRLRNDTAGAIDPASATWKVSVIQ